MISIRIEALPRTPHQILLAPRGVVRASSGVPPTAALDVLAAAVTLAGFDAQEARGAFTERRKPRFS